MNTTRKTSAGPEQQPPLLGAEPIPAPNGEDPAPDAEQIKKLAPKVDLAKALLMPNPDTLTTVAEQILIDVVGTLEPTEFFRTHPTMRLTLNLVTPNRQDIGAQDYAVLPEGLPLLARHKMHPSLVTLYPVVLDTKPLTYKLMRVKHPTGGRKWDKWNLSRKQALERAMDEWIALRQIPGGGYEWVFPDPEAIFPEPVFPDWTEGDWLQRSFGAQDLILGNNENHDVFRALRGLK
jgi:hypothetical protein